MLYVFKPFWSLLTKGGEAYELIVFKRVHMGGCFIFCLVFTTLTFETFALVARHEAIRILVAYANHRGGVRRRTTFHGGVESNLNLSVKPSS